jgi:hypothetical protein
VELGTSLLLLNHFRAQHVETSLIPDVNSQLITGYKAYWGMSIVAAAQAWWGGRVVLSWQAVAVVNDMIVRLVDR